MLAIVDQRPRVLNLLEACELFLDFRREVVRRRTAFELRKAEARAHVLEGYVIALDHLDEVIALIRGGQDARRRRKTGLIEPLRRSREIQADAILEAAAAAPDRPGAPEDRGRARRRSGS